MQRPRSRSMTNAGMAMSCLTWLMVIVFLSTTTTATAEVKVTNDSKDQALSPQRVKILSFDLTLSPTTTALTPSEEDTLRSTAQIVLDGYMSPLALDKNLRLDYVLLADIEANTFNRQRRQQRTRRSRRQLQSTGEQSSTLKFQGGIASFTGNGTTALATGEVYGWVATALEEDLALALQDTELSYITTVKFDPSTIAPSMAPSMMPSVDKPVSFGVTVSDIEEGGSNRMAPIAIGVGAAGAVLAVAVFLLFAGRRRHREAQQMSFHEAQEAHEASESEYSEDDSGAAIPLPATLGINSNSNNSTAVTAVNSRDSSSLTSSDFTLGTINTTDQEDTLNYKHTIKTAGHKMMHQESFERDRQVTSLQKDMLQTSWTGNFSSTRQPKHENTMLLQPNHFSPADDQYPMEQNSNNNHNDEPFLFEGAGGEGEDVYLMPPSQTRTSREAQSPTASSAAVSPQLA